MINKKDDVKVKEWIPGTDFPFLQCWKAVSQNKCGFKCCDLWVPASFLLFNKTVLNHWQAVKVYEC